MKKCLYKGCNNPPFGGGYCKYYSHQAMRTDAAWLRSLAKKEAKRNEPKKQIRKQGKKRKKEKDEYSRLREEFFKRPENQKCRVFPNLDATDVHHMWGTENWRLLIVEWWLPVSREGHKYIHDHPEEAFAKKWSYYRNRDINIQIKPDES